MRSVVVWCVFAWTLAGPAAADESAEAGRALMEKHSAAVVTLRLTLTEKYSMPGMATEEDESTLETIGTVVDPSGLAVTSLSTVDPSYMAEAMLDFEGEEDVSYESRVTGSKMLLADGREVPVKLVLRDKELDLAVFKPEQAPAEPLTFMDLANAGEAAAMDPVVVLFRLGKVAGRTIGGYTERINAVLQRPRRFYVLIGAMAWGGCPVFTRSGRLLGITVTRRIETDANIFESVGSWLDTELPVVVPAADVLEVVKQAGDEKAEEAAPAAKP
jgi:hypothetical protein